MEVEQPVKSLKKNKALDFNVITNEITQNIRTRARTKIHPTI